jgi:hypothetical protein
MNKVMNIDLQQQQLLMKMDLLMGLMPLAYK